MMYEAVAAGLPAEPAGDAVADATAVAGATSEAAGDPAAVKGLPAEAAGDSVAATVGQTAPARTHSTSAWTSSGFSCPPFGIFNLSLVWRTAWMSTLLSGSPGAIAGPDLPPLSSPSRESTRSPPICWS